MPAILEEFIKTIFFLGGRVIRLDRCAIAQSDQSILLHTKSFHLKLSALIVYFLIAVALGFIYVSSASAVEYLPENEEFFDIVLVTPDVSPDPGYQIEASGLDGERWFQLDFDLPGPTVYDAGEATRNGRYLAFEPTHSGTEALGYDDIVMRNYRPDGGVHWEWDESYNAGGIVFDSWSRNQHLVVIIQVRWERDIDFTDGWTDLDFFTGTGGISGKRSIPSRVKLGVFDNYLSFNSGRSDPWILPGDQVYLEFKGGTFQTGGVEDVIKVTTDPDTYALQKNNRAAFHFEIVAADRINPEVLHLNYIAEEADWGQRYDLPLPPEIFDPFVAFPDFRQAREKIIPTEVDGPFTMEFLLTEKPMDATAASLLTVTNGTVTGFEEITDYDQSGKYDLDRDGWLGLREDKQSYVATGREPRLYAWRVEITPNADATGDIVVSVNRFGDRVLPTPNYFTGTYQVTIPLSEAYQMQAASREIPPPAITGAAKLAENHLTATPNLTQLPEKLVIPANGYLVLARGEHDSDVLDNNAPIEHSPPKPADKMGAQKLYNIHYGFGLPFPANDLANLFQNGGTLQLLHRNIPENSAGKDDAVGYPGANNINYAAGAVLINEIMWGMDRTQVSSQYIELHNTTNAPIGIDKNEWVIAVGVGSDPVYTTVVDVMSNKTPHWDAPGQSGATVVSDAVSPGVAYPLADLVSMARVGADGRLRSSWSASVRPSANLHGRRIGSPGAANTAEPIASPGVSGTPVASADDIVITEIMADTNAGSLPQWIELANVSPNTVSLEGWSVSIMNSRTDNVGSVYLSLEGLEVASGQVVLIVSGAGRQSLNAVNPARVVNARKPLLSETGFLITLLSPSGTGDRAGNLAEDWELPSVEVGRRSLVRAPTGAGTEAGTWSLAERLTRSYVETYYGQRADVGTPGWHGSGGALPVELSVFVASRDRVTGAVEIRWETASESNNAGFYITRSETRDGTFTTINASMIPGAGTTSEKQAYRYIDTTAKPNVVYYYQIEDVSLEGERQVLVSPHRLRGHISASGKTTLLWGDLKARE